MVDLVVHVDENVLQSIRRTAKLRGLSEQQCVEQILQAHHEEYRQFPDGVLREGRETLISLLSEIPCLHNFDSSGVDFRYWWVTFELDIASPIAWAVVRKLGLLLNTKSTEMMLPTVFSPLPSEHPEDPMDWKIASTAPRLDPQDVEAWLRAKLPKPLTKENSWMTDGEIKRAR